MSSASSPSPGPCSRCRRRLYYGLHHWTAAHTGGVVDARFIALIDTAVDSPLGQISMIPMLAWIANSAPDAAQGDLFRGDGVVHQSRAVAGQLGTKYLNEIFIVTREVRDPATGAVEVAGQLQPARAVVHHGDPDRAPAAVADDSAGQAHATGQRLTGRVSHGPFEPAARRG